MVKNVLKILFVTNLLKKLDSFAYFFQKWVDNDKICFDKI